MVSPRILMALKDCRTFRPGEYMWKRKSMEKAAALGLTREVPSNKYPGQTAFELTAAGLAVIAEASGLPTDFSEGEANSLSR